MRHVLCELKGAEHKVEIQHPNFFFLKQLKLVHQLLCCSPHKTSGFVQCGVMLLLKVEVAVLIAVIVLCRDAANSHFHR